MGRIGIPWMFLISWAIGGGESLAHMDRILAVGDNGTITGLPAEFGTAAVHIEFASSASDPPVSEVIVDLGGNHISLPRCVSEVLTSRAMSEVRVSASWYHDESRLPYYLNLTFPDPGAGKSAWTESGHWMLFNLRSGKLIKMVALVAHENGNSRQLLTVDLSARCPPAALKEILDEPAGTIR